MTDRPVAKKAGAGSGCNQQLLVSLGDFKAKVASGKDAKKYENDRKMNQPWWERPVLQRLTSSSRPKTRHGAG